MKSIEDISIKVSLNYNLYRILGFGEAFVSIKFKYDIIFFGKLWDWQQISSDGSYVKNILKHYVIGRYQFRHKVRCNNKFKGETLALPTRTLSFLSKAHNYATKSLERLSNEKHLNQQSRLENIDIFEPGTP